MTASSYRVLALGLLRPLTLAALVLELEVIGVLAAAGIECLLAALALAILMPYALASRRRPESVHVDLDGFSATWPARPELTEEEPALPALVLAIWAGVGGIPLVSLVLWLTESVSEGSEAVIIACLMAIPVFLTQFAAMWALRALVSALRKREDVVVEQSGRVLTVGEERWTRSGADQVESVRGCLRISRGDALLEVPGNAHCRRWLEARLEETRPPEEEAVVPEALAAMRE